MSTVTLDDGAGRHREDLMAYRELTMLDVRELLRRWQSRHSIKTIAREAGIDRKTIRRYIAAAEALGVAQDAVLSDDVVHAVAQFVQARPAPATSEARQDLAPERARIEAWLEAKPPLQLTRIHTLLLPDGVAVSYATLRRFAMQEFGWGLPKVTVRLTEPPAGQEAQIDFAEMGRVVDPETGRPRKLHVLIVTLSFSRYTFVWPTWRKARCPHRQATGEGPASSDLTTLPFGVVTRHPVGGRRLCIPVSHDGENAGSHEAEQRQIHSTTCHRDRSVQLLDGRSEHLSMHSGLVNRARYSWSPCFYRNLYRYFHHRHVAWQHPWRARDSSTGQNFGSAKNRQHRAERGVLDSVQRVQCRFPRFFPCPQVLSSKVLGPYECFGGRVQDTARSFLHHHRNVCAQSHEEIGDSCTEHEGD